MGNAAPPEKRRALVISFDEESKALRFTDVDPDAIADLVKDHVVGELPLSEYVDLAPEAAEAKLGAGVLSFLEYAVGRPLGIRNYREETQRELETYRQELEALAASGDPGANYHMYVECSSRAVRLRSESELDRANQFLARAVQLGHRKAAEAFDDWSLLRAELSARIRGSDA